MDNQEPQAEVVPAALDFHLRSLKNGCFLMTCDQMGGIVVEGTSVAEALHNLSAAYQLAEAWRREPDKHKAIEIARLQES